MGRTKRNHTKAARQTASLVPSPLPPQSAQTTAAMIEDLMPKAHTLVAQQSYPLAAQLLAHVLTLDPTLSEAREMLAVCELEEGNVQAAVEHFTHLTLPPNPSPSAHLYLAQLAPDPHASLAHYEASMPLLESQLAELVTLRAELPDHPPSGQPAEVEAADEVRRARDECVQGELELKEQMCRALVAMTEIYLTDLCMEPQAEDACLLFLQKALALCPLDPEAWLTLASVRLSQQAPLEALACLARAWSTWKHLLLGHSPGSHPTSSTSSSSHPPPPPPPLPPTTMRGTDSLPAQAQIQAAAAQPLSLTSSLPSIQTRLAVARLMAELGLHRQALLVLGSVRESDDEEVEGAYLEGWVWYMRGLGEGVVFTGREKEMEGLEMVEEEDEDEGEVGKVECWEEARESLTVCVLLHQAQSHPTQAILEHATELLQALDEAGIRPARGVVDDDDDDDDDGEGGMAGDGDEWADEDDEMDG